MNKITIIGTGSVGSTIAYTLTATNIASEIVMIDVDTLKSIIPQITNYAPDATYVIVSNPVYILTYTFCKCSDIPKERIIGSGTILDTARLRSRLAEYFSLSQ